MDLFNVLGAALKPEIFIDLTKVSDVKVEDIDFKDAPDFCDAFIAYAEYDGYPMSQEMLNDLNENEYYEEFLSNAIQSKLY